MSAKKVDMLFLITRYDELLKILRKKDVVWKLDHIVSQIVLRNCMIDH